MNGKTSFAITLTMLCIISTSIFSFQQATAQPQTWTVDDDGPADFHTIQQAINAANPRDTIHVHNGTYREHPIITKRNLTLIGEHPNNTIIDGEGTRSVVQIQADNVTFSGFTVRNSSKADWDCAGIFFRQHRYITIIENTIEHCASGIIAGYSHANIIRQNTIVNFTYGGIILYESTFNTIESNYATTNVSWPQKGQLGIHLDFEANNNIIADNTVVSSQFGIEIERSSRNEFINNTMLGNRYGLTLYNWYMGHSGTENRFRLNNLTNNDYSFVVSGYHLHHFIQDADTSNTIDGKPIMYLVNQHNLTVDPSTHPNPGYLGLINCSNISIQNIKITKNPIGITMAYTKNSMVSNARISHHMSGIGLIEASNNTIKCNNVTHNDYAMTLYNANNNTIFHNNFIDNNQTIHDYAMDLTELPLSTNTWDNGYPSGGNYWGDYTGADYHHGPYQNETRGDGIGDTPYLIENSDQDNYPLMKPWAEQPPAPETIDGLKTETEQLCLHGEISNQGTLTSLIAKLNAAQKLVSKGKTHQAKRILTNAFIQQIQSLSGIRITLEASDILIKLAEHIMANL